ncbi:MAG: sulfotransferase domain-containing protein [Pseudomonadales bacterium]|nr:sulfotransferase domain-containing protein [Pseudomonadales bacterium]MDP6473007.1 sulfotransferase domain-containing protein [Pseudomonadales bacterium]MDP6826236.1 sulfotransferase domain-containing protein [Pseudomonadales bacterium]
MRKKGGTTTLHRYLEAHPDILPASAKELGFFSDNYQLGMEWYLRQFPSRYKRVHRDFPDAKLIVMLRNPVDRAFSRYRYHLMFGEGTLSFEEAVDAEEKRLAGEFERLAHDPGYAAVNLRNYSYLRRGMYAEQLQRWLGLFERSRLFIMQSEDFFDDPKGLYGEVQDFLGIHQHTRDRYDRFNPGQNDVLSPGLRARLVDYFAPHNERLYALLRRDFGWD